jgi:hypothetical protein
MSMIRGFWDPVGWTRVNLRVLALGGAALVACALGAPAHAAAATGPVVTNVLETGPSRGITGFRATFNRAMNRAEARTVANYALFGIRAGGARTRIPLRSAVYSPSKRSVKATAARPFAQTRFRRLRIHFNGRRGGLADLRGRLLDGNRDGRAGGDAVSRFRLITGTNVSFRDRDGDRATISIRNGGRLDAIAPIGGPPRQNSQFWVLDPNANQSTLSGTVRPAPNSDGTVTVAEISGTSGIDTTAIVATLPCPPPPDRRCRIQVNTLTFSSNATGIG